MSRKIKYWHSYLMGQRELLVKGMSTADDSRGGSKQKTLYTYLSIHPVWRALFKKKMPSYFILP